MARCFISMIRGLSTHFAVDQVVILVNFLTLDSISPGKVLESSLFPLNSYNRWITLYDTERGVHRILLLGLLGGGAGLPLIERR